MKTKEKRTKMKVTKAKLYTELFLTNREKAIKGEPWFTCASLSKLISKDYPVGLTLYHYTLTGEQAIELAYQILDFFEKELE